MILDLFKTNELTAISRKLLDANKELVDSVLSTSQDVVKKGINYNNSVVQVGAGVLTSTREELNRVLDTVFEQTGKIEERALEVIDSSSDKTTDRVNEVFERLGNPADVIGGAVEDTVLDSIEGIAEPTVDLLKNSTEQVTEVSKKLLNTAALVDTKPAPVAKKTAPVAKKPVAPVEEVAAVAAPEVEAEVATEAAATEEAPKRTRKAPARRTKKAAAKKA